MKKTLFSFAIAIFITVLLTVSGCGSDNGGQPAQGRTSRQESVVGSPKEYFPTDIGLKWIYQISISETVPQSYRETAWPLGESNLTYSSRGYFLGAIQDESQKSQRLAIRVKNLADKQGPLEFPLGRQLDVVEDELGIFREVKHAFWAVNTSHRYAVHLVEIHDAMYSPMGSSMGWRDGYSIRLIFFSSKPGLQIGLGEDAMDALLFDGVDDQVQGYRGEQLLHFVRTVKASKERNSDLDAGFVEHTWFAKGKGLVRLEQKINGKTSMTWTLESFTKE